MKEHIAPKMASGEWTGTMCLTEPHCGTDLRLMKTRAVEQDDGTYRITGTKIFISGGDHDLTDNIIHMVIAKIPDENGKIHDDLSTVNFFMVPKFLVSEDGKLGARNGVTTGGIEKKMGIKGNATCVLNFDDAVGLADWAKAAAASPGDEKTQSSSAGMAGMFGMMNPARLGVGMQGIGIGEVAYQNAAAYVHERRVGRALTGPKAPDKPADLEIVQPDVQAHASPMPLVRRRRPRPMAMWTTLQHGSRRSGRPEEERQDRRLTQRSDDAGRSRPSSPTWASMPPTLRCSVMAAMAISATTASSSSCAMPASIRPTKAPTAFRRWISSAAS